MISPSGSAADDDDDDEDVDMLVPASSFSNSGQKNKPSPVAKLDDVEWTQSCLPRLLDVMNKGAGHAVVHDMQWTDGSLRVATLLQNMAASPTNRQSTNRQSTTGPPYPNYGPHLVVTSSGEDFDKFASVFAQLTDGGVRSVVKNKGDRRSNNDLSDDDDISPLRVLPYHGPKDHRRQLRKHFGSLSPSPESHFSFLGGLPDSPFHVIVTTHTELMEDYAHFCQIPFQVVVLDDGMSWLGCAQSDPHGKLGKVWNSGLWSNFDFGAGGAGVARDGGHVTTCWDFSKDVCSGMEASAADDKKQVVNKPKSPSKSSNNTVTINGIGERSHGKPPIGLTARHRILLASSMHATYRGQVYKAPVMGLLSFLAPQFAETIKDDWERSRIFSCKKSMTYIRTNIARSIVVYSGATTTAHRRSPNDLVMLSMKGLDAELPLRNLKTCPGQEDDRLEFLIKSQKIVHSRKFAVSWFQPTSPIRKEVETMVLDPILTAVKKGNAMGFICEEVVTASSLTTSGAGGCVVGLSAYRAAVRCGRCFSSEQGLKQHVLSSHAPPGTWLCRSCGGDCGTSQARTHHERSCKAPRRVSIQSSSLGGGAAAPVIVGQEISKPKRGPKRKIEKILEAAQSAKDEGGDGDGSTRVPGYKGVWVLANGKYFVKVGVTPIVDNDAEKETLSVLFDTANAAAKKFDEVMADKGKEAPELEMNYKSDGSRIVHKEGTDGGPPAPKSTEESSGSGGINFIVPDLSVIDVKKLPPHVKPLLRDPNFTSRTGGNSKRYVYAYRGVCRQQRKGHDRWQSQISFNGQNHYLGTFDSEWDAAAVYSWAHLILYGEEATKKAQQEGEEAAAAFAQHEKDIAEGKVPPPSPKPAKKKKRGAPKKIKTSSSSEKPLGKNKPKEGMKSAEELPETKGNTVVSESHASVHSKKKRPASLKEWSKLKTECAMMLSSGTKGTSKATILATRKDIADMSEKVLLRNLAGYISGHPSSVSNTFLHSNQLPAGNGAPLNNFNPSMVRPCRNAVLIGLQASDFGWDMKKFLGACQNANTHNAVALSLKLSNEFGPVGANKLFCTFLLSPSITMGRASNGSLNVFLASARVNSTLGMPVGQVDCDMGGPDYSCSEMAARIQFLPSKYGNFQFMACNDDDIITVNGHRISASMGSHPLQDRDICSVGARVFVFMENIVSNN